MEKTNGVHGKPRSKTLYVSGDLTLRDYFAAKAMQGSWPLEGSWSLESTNPVLIDGYKNKLKTIVEASYMAADAMMAAREKK